MPLIYSEGTKNAFSRLEDRIKRLRKHQLDEISTVLEAAFNSSKRLRTPRSQLSFVPPHRDPNFLDPEPLSHSEYSVHDGK
jgi:hypothetical protein